MAFITQCWSSTPRPERRSARWSVLRIALGAMLGALLAACGGTPSSIAVRAAELKRDGEPALDVTLTLALSADWEAALDRGIPLTLRFELSDGQQRTERHLRLRYAPLAQQYQLIDVERGSSRGFARRSQLLVSLDRVRLPLDPAWAGAGSALELSVAFDRSTLPAALRLPSLIERRWQITGAEYRWTCAG